jgi:transcriptional regulator with XRE-family HTH domain
MYLVNKKIPPNRFKELRQEKHLSLLDLENTFNISNSSLSQFENCFREMPLEKIIRFCDYFKVSMDYMFCRSNIRLMAHQLPEKQLNDLLSHNEQDILSSLRRISNESTLQVIKGVVEAVSNNGGNNDTTQTVIDTPNVTPINNEKEIKQIN